MVDALRSVNSGCGHEHHEDVELDVSQPEGHAALSLGLNVLVREANARHEHEHGVRQMDRALYLLQEHYVEMRKWERKQTILGRKRCMIKSASTERPRMSVSD